MTHQPPPIKDRETQHHHHHHTLDSHEPAPHSSFSPTKARHATQLASQWSQVHRWLEQIFDPDPVPDLGSKSQGLLTYLLQLQQLNKSADRTEQLLHAAREEILARIRSSPSNSSDPDTTSLKHLTGSRVTTPSKGKSRTELLNRVHAALPGTTRTKITDLANLSLSLGLPAPPASSMETVATSIQSALISRAVDRTIEACQVGQLDVLDAEMEDENDRLDRILERLRLVQPGEEDIERLHDQTAQWARESKLLARKTTEYHERLSGLETWVAPSPDVDDVCLQEQKVKRWREEVDKLQTRLAGYHGLPPNIEIAREEVRRAQAELEGLKKKKGALFAQMLQD